MSPRKFRQTLSDQERLKLSAKHLDEAIHRELKGLVVCQQIRRQMLLLNLILLLITGTVSTLCITGMAQGKVSVMLGVCLGSPFMGLFAKALVDLIRLSREYWDDKQLMDWVLSDIILDA